MIQLQNIKKSFDDLEALADINLHVNKGAIYGLLGSNGAGKTTLLKIIAGIYTPDSGLAKIDDHFVFENLDIKQRTIFIADSLYFFPLATIEQMASFYRSIYANWNEERYQKLRSAFNLDFDKRIDRMSKGMQRQVAFWLALACMPDVLVLDEPFDGLDAIMRKKIKNLLVQDVAERDMTILISSHNLREVEDLCDSIGIMHKGRIIVEKDLDDLKSDVHKIQVAFTDSLPEQFLAPFDLLYQEQRGSVYMFIVRGKSAELQSYITATNPLVFDMLGLTLEEIFIYEMRDVGYAIENIVV